MVAWSPMQLSVVGAHVFTVYAHARKIDVTVYSESQQMEIVTVRDTGLCSKSAGTNVIPTTRKQSIWHFRQLNDGVH
ncbi:hypothetical protein N7452_007105 [Penicillium brevicompactum]|uniref:Uncharacterized protein n=1 Tax=Penicillium brevicompactum TaxID=5074 RepID=A0A9W9QER9_PENBR|nr:hypothetical protein N7452_007105 [Penicillium brevicompactum]